jgi:hypothetical protein
MREIQFGKNTHDISLTQNMFAQQADAPEPLTRPGDP